MTQERAEPVFLFTQGVLENQIQEFQGPCPFSPTFKAWKIRKKIQEYFQGLSMTSKRPALHPGSLVHLQLVT